LPLAQRNPVLKGLELVAIDVEALFEQIFSHAVLVLAFQNASGFPGGWIAT